MRKEGYREVRRAREELILSAVSRTGFDKDASSDAGVEDIVSITSDRMSIKSRQQFV